MSAQNVFPLAELTPDAAKRVVLDGTAIAVVLDGTGTIHAIGDTCTHGDISLSEGFVEDDTLECWAHGSKFDLRTGRPLTLPAYQPVPVFRVTVEGTDVLVDATPVAPEDLPD